MTARPFDRDLYEVLGVGPTASADEITSAYRRRARELHPDSSADAAGDASGFIAVLGAYEVLHDPERRTSYDAARGRRATQTRSTNGVPIPVRHVRSATAPPAGTWPRGRPIHPGQPYVLGSRPGFGSAQFMEPDFDFVGAIMALLRGWD